MSTRQVQILCSSCKRDTLLVREPVYEGFKKTGESLKCASCGHEYASESEVPFKQTKAARVFDESDASRKVTVFANDERGRTCMYCKHYIVNPFTQKCGLHLRTVEATDACAQFTVKESATKKPEDGNQS